VTKIKNEKAGVKTENGKTTKTSGNNADSEKVEFSLNLVKVFDRRYKEIDVWPLCQKYLEFCMKYQNHNQNTKYCLLYILKTHKKYYEEFKEFQIAKTMEEFCKILKITY
jgi:hypothetical protein